MIVDGSIIGILKSRRQLEEVDGVTFVETKSGRFCYFPYCGKFVVYREEQRNKMLDDDVVYRRVAICNSLDKVFNHLLMVSGGRR